MIGLSLFKSLGIYQKLARTEEDVKSASNAINSDIGITPPTEPSKSARLDVCSGTAVKRKYQKLLL